MAASNLYGNNQSSPFHGSWRFLRSKGYEAFIEEIYREKLPHQPWRLTSPSPTIDISVLGDKFTIQGETTRNTLTVGQPQVDRNHWVDETRVARWEGNKLVVESPDGGGKWTTISEVTNEGNRLIIKYVVKANGVETVCFYERAAAEPNVADE